MVGAVQGVAAVGELLRRRRRLPRVARRADASRLARLRPGAALRREVGLRPRPERHAGDRARELSMEAAAISALLALALRSRRRGGAAADAEPGRARRRRLDAGDGFQVGAVRGANRVLAKGLEIDLARALAKRLGVPRVRFVNEPFFSTLVSGRPGTGISRSPRSRSRQNAPAGSTSPRPTSPGSGRADAQGPRPVPTSIAGLRELQLCGERATTGTRAIVERIKPTKKPRLVANPSQLTYDLYNDRCDAIVFDTAALGAARAAAPERYGPFPGRIDTRESYGAAFPKGSILRTERERGSQRADSRRHGGPAAEALALRRRRQTSILR